jgi:3-phenylpropionate/trans-cinnamate dioxygenase ferredoxin reductase subunit
MATGKRGAAMERRKYLIVGGGLAADAAVRGIRERDGAGSILVVSDEDRPPYDRPPLSKALWKGTPVDRIWRHTESAGAELRLGTQVVTIDRAARTARDAKGTTFAYDKLLLATGGSPRRLPRGHSGVIYFRRFADFERTWKLAGRGAEFAVIGGGFIGSEIAAALSINGRKVSMVFPNACIGDHLYPRPLANFLNLYFRKRGVEVRFNERVERIDEQAGRLLVHTSDGGSVAADAVVAGIGIEPNVELANAASLDADGGIVVDEMLRTNDPDIFAAGDAANFPCSALRRRLRFEHEDNAEATGRIAGRNMAGDSEPYRHLPSFYSDLFDLSYEAVGDINNRMEVVEDWIQKFRKGVIYYLRENRVQGVLLWNIRGLVDAARGLITAGEEHRTQSLIGRLRD